MVQISQEEFWQKVIILGLEFSVFLGYIFFRAFKGGWRFLGSGQSDEGKLLSRGDIDIDDLQSRPWLFNGEKALTYASFSVGTLILAVVFIFEQNLRSYDAFLFEFILAIFALSVVVYFASLQMWFMALDVGGSNLTKLMYRRWATIFQSIGWVCIQVATVTAIMVINTFLGTIFGILSVLLTIFVYEAKGEASLREEVERATVNEFQKSIHTNDISVKNETTKLSNESINVLRLVTWNIERGYRPEKIVEFLNIIGADIVCLQEVDWGNRRTGDLDILNYIAQGTGMRGFFSTEFYELDTPKRTPRNAGGGVHGNAILTKFTPARVWRVDLPQFFDWSNTDHRQGRLERRIGGRFALCMEIENLGSNVIICSTHFENRAGGTNGRYLQLKYLLTQLENEMYGFKNFVIAGDLNTLENWLTRLLRLSKAEELRKYQWDTSECDWWVSTILPQHDLSSKSVCTDWTYRKGFIYKEKLDWIITSGDIIPTQSNVGRIDLSDHRPVWADLRFQ